MAPAALVTPSARAVALAAVLVTLWGFRPKAPRVPDAGAIAEARSRVGADAVRFDRTSRTVRFDRPGMEIDLGGIAKGYALDVARQQVAGRSRPRLGRQ